MVIQKAHGLAVRGLFAFPVAQVFRAPASRLWNENDGGARNDGRTPGGPNATRVPWRRSQPRRPSAARRRCLSRRPRLSFQHQLFPIEERPATVAGRFFVFADIAAGLLSLGVPVAFGVGDAFPFGEVAVRRRAGPRAQRPRHACRLREFVACCHDNTPSPKKCRAPAYRLPLWRLHCNVSATCVCVQRMQRNVCQRHRTLSNKDLRPAVSLHGTCKETSLCAKKRAWPLPS